MTEGVMVAVITSAVTLILGLLALVKGRGQPGVTVTAAASQSDVQSTNNAVAALANTVREQGEQLAAQRMQLADAARQVAALGDRVDDLEGRERSYLTRIAELEEWGQNAEGPPPRPIPAWRDRPL